MSSLRNNLKEMDDIIHLRSKAIETVNDRTEYFAKHGSRIILNEDASMATATDDEWNYCNEIVGNKCINLNQDEEIKSYRWRFRVNQLQTINGRKMKYKMKIGIAAIPPNRQNWEVDYYAQYYFESQGDIVYVNEHADRKRQENAGSWWKNNDIIDLILTELRPGQWVLILDNKTANEYTWMRMNKEDIQTDNNWYMTCWLNKKGHIIELMDFERTKKKYGNIYDIPIVLPILRMNNAYIYAPLLAIVAFGIYYIYNKKRNNTSKEISADRD